MLLSSGQPLPTDIVVHDYLTAGGRKISKSSGSAADPAALAAEYGTDAVRWWLLREVPRVGDADFTVERMTARADDELANGLGNLVNRVVAMIPSTGTAGFPGPAAGSAAGGEDLAAAIGQAGELIAAAALADFDFRQATAAVWAIADEANRFINRVRPWELARAERDGGTASAAGCRPRRALRGLLGARPGTGAVPAGRGGAHHRPVHAPRRHIAPRLPVFRRLSPGNSAREAVSSGGVPGP